MEDDPNFNAGRGAAITGPGHVETDASLMNGRDMSAGNVERACQPYNNTHGIFSTSGSVASISGIKNPITAAQRVMELTPHVQLAGPSAAKWVETWGVETAEEVGECGRILKSNVIQQTITRPKTNQANKINSHKIL